MLKTDTRDHEILNKVHDSMLDDFQISEVFQIFLLVHFVRVAFPRKYLRLFFYLSKKSAQFDVEF